MKIYKTQEEVELDIEDGILDCKFQDVKFGCSITIEASIINANNIKAYDINANNIKAYDINAYDINANNIDTYDIYASNIKANNIDASNIKANNIDASNIKAYGINANNITYYAFCIAYSSIKCKSWEKKRDNALDPICLDGKLEIIQDELHDIEVEKAIKLLEERGKLKDGKILT
jgi:hypothetical protein